MGRVLGAGVCVGCWVQVCAWGVGCRCVCGGCWVQVCVGRVLGAGVCVGCWVQVCVWGVLGAGVCDVHMYIGVHVCVGRYYTCVGMAGCLQMCLY